MMSKGKLLWLAAAATAASLPGAAGASAGELKAPAGSWTFHHEHVLGTSLEVRVRAHSFAQARLAEAAALVELDRQDALLSAWRPASEFSRWARTRMEPVPVSPDLYNVLAGFDHWRTETSGALDPSTEAALRLWRAARAQGRVPTPAELAQTAEAMQQPHWQLDPARHTATRLTDVPLALASFAKSYAAEQAAGAALRAGAAGIMLNLGGDIVVRGALAQTVDLADPHASSENDVPLARLTVANGAVATSGSYRRGVELHAALHQAHHAPRYSHIVDPRTARPTGHVLSSTVLAPNGETAGALATAMSVLTPLESERLAARIPGVSFLLVLADGSRLTSPGWPHSTTPATPRLAAFSTPLAAPAEAAPYELTVSLELPRIDDARYRRPYVAVWIEDSDHFPVRTLALWSEKPRWLPELKQWYRDDQLRNLSEGTDISRTVGSATRPPGHYTLRWDGKDNQGNPVKPGTYALVLEASREHGSYQVERHPLTVGPAAPAQQASLPAGGELGEVTLELRKR